MPFTVPTLDQMTAFLVGFWKSFNPLSNVNSKFSYHWKRLRAYAGAITDLHAHIDSAQRDVMPDTATGAFLTRWGKISGVPKKGATAASGSAALKVTGVATVGAVSIGDQLKDPATGLRYQITENLTIPSAGYAFVDIEGIDTGAQTNITKGTQLQFVATPANVNAIAALVADLTGGFDDEADPSYSVRVNDQLGKPRMGGSQDDFVAWCLQVTGVAAGYCYPNRAGVGTVDVVALQAGNGSTRSLTTAQRTAVINRITGADGQANLLGAAPCQVSGSGGSLRLLTTAVDTKNVEITVEDNGDPAYERDWDDSTPLVVLAYTPATLRVQFSAPLPGSMLAGQRIVFRGVASAQDGSLFTIEQVVASDTIALRETPAINLAATDVAYAGGPLTQPIRDAIVAHMNGEIVYADNGVPTPESVATSVVGLNVLADGIGPANPGGEYGPWSGSLLVSVLDKIAGYPTGARNVSVITPAADYDATDPVFPLDGSTNFIGPGAVLIRYE